MNGKMLYTLVLDALVAMLIYHDASVELRQHNLSSATETRKEMGIYLGS